MSGGSRAQVRVQVFISFGGNTASGSCSSQPMAMANPADIASQGLLPKDSKSTERAGTEAHPEGTAPGPHQ